MKFNYLALTADQTVSKGDIVAPDEISARRKLLDQGMEVVMMKKKSSFSQMEIIIGRVSQRDLLFFVKHLGLMLKSGLGLFEALDMIREQAKGRLKQTLEKVINDVAGGSPLSDALAKHPKDFPELFVQLVRSGEISGTLEENLAYISEFVKKEIDLKKKVRGAMLYPAVVLFAVIGLVISIGLFVLPKILPLFESLDVELPFSTKVLLWFANVFEAYGILIVAAMIFLSIATPIVAELKFMRPFSHRVYLRIPMVGKLMKQLYLARFFRVAGNLMNAGIPIDQTIEITRNVIRNAAYKRSLIDVRAAVVQGGSISASLQKNEFLYPSMVGHMLYVGERSGNLSESMNYLGDYFEEELDDKLKNLSVILEPFLLVFIGVIVAMVAFAIIGPIYSITANLR